MKTKIIVKPIKIDGPEGIKFDFGGAEIDVEYESHEYQALLQFQKNFLEMAEPYLARFLRQETILN